MRSWVFFVPIIFFSASIFSFPSSSQELTLEEKVGQLIMAHIHAQELNAEAERYIHELGIGGVIYYNWSNGLNSPEQVRTLSQGLQKLASASAHAIPLLIATDQEGGIVARLKSGFTEFPGNKALGMSRQPQLAEEAAYQMGLELKSVGVNMNLAPVVDINSEPRNPIIGIRSFGENPEVVVTFGERALKGYHAAGLITTLKHFPGHGDTRIDSHEALPLISHSMERLEKMELVPFARLNAMTDVIMTAHILVPALDAHQCSTLSKPTLDYLRKMIGFNGVIIADSLVMEGVLKRTGSVDQAAIQSLNAGCDILLLGGKQLQAGGQQLELNFDDVRRVKESLIEAVKTGRIAESRLNDAVNRILKLKKNYLDSSLEKTHEMSLSVDLPQKIAASALEVHVDRKLWSKGWQKKKILLIAPEVVSADLAQTSWVKMSEILYFFGLNPTPEFIEKAELMAKGHEAIIFLSYNAWKNSGQETLIEKFSKQKGLFGLISLRDPLDLGLINELSLKVATFSPSQVSLQAAYDKLVKESKR